MAAAVSESQAEPRFPDEVLELIRANYTIPEACFSKPPTAIQLLKQLSPVELAITVLLTLLTLGSVAIYVEDAAYLRRNIRCPIKRRTLLWKSSAPTLLLHLLLPADAGDGGRLWRKEGDADSSEGYADGRQHGPLLLLLSLLPSLHHDQEEAAAADAGPLPVRLPQDGLRPGGVAAHARRHLRPLRHLRSQHGPLDQHLPGRVHFISPLEPGHRLPPGQGTLGRAEHQGQVLSIPDGPHPHRPAALHLLGAGQYWSYCLFAPLLPQNQVSGDELPPAHHGDLSGNGGHPDLLPPAGRQGRVRSLLLSAARLGHPSLGGSGPAPRTPRHPSRIRLGLSRRRRRGPAAGRRRFGGRHRAGCPGPRGPGEE
ncbi:organic solute transporter subunit alpha isoform X1 [Ornithorhynchus anatinus]|uniref:organic solute transporter subunit alpha isoform X1 n=1 Tax=Ornithorhynchus anatinus TaxID=9258 RepID=UPI0010A83D59|nr:organic solute transporter subunit alpha isoform X1 [Ornithorhynchus anatinus]